MEKGEEQRTFARDAQDAAQTFCEVYDVHGDYAIAHAGDATVIVYTAGMELAGVFEVEVEARPHYYATQARLTDEERKVLAHETNEVEWSNVDG